MTASTVPIDDWRLEFRAIRPADRQHWLELLRTMSWATRFKRGARRVDQLTAADIDQAVSPDPETELAFVAMANRGTQVRMSGIARAALGDGGTWTFTLVVLDDWQRRGIGGRLMRELIAAARVRGAAAIEGEVLATNGNMLDFVRRLGFEVCAPEGGALVRRVVLRLAP